MAHRDSLISLTTFVIASLDQRRMLAMISRRLAKTSIDGSDQVFSVICLSSDTARLAKSGH